METRSPAQVYALVMGATLVVVGILGFFYSASFGSGDDTAREAVLGILDVNGWHNLLHIASGVLGLALIGSYPASRAYAFGLGALYLVVTLLRLRRGRRRRDPQPDPGEHRGQRAPPADRLRGHSRRLRHAGEPAAEHRRSRLRRGYPPRRRRSMSPAASRTARSTALMLPDERLRWR